MRGFERFVVRRDGEIRGQTGRVLYGNEKPYMAVLFDFVPFSENEVNRRFDPLSNPVFPKYQSRLRTKVLEGHATPLWDQRGVWRTWAIPAPNGRELAIGTMARSSNVWMIENL